MISTGDLLSQFKSYVNQKKLFGKDDLLLLGVSGGVDSVVLCELCYLAGFIFQIAHANFQLRGEESDRDEKFVRTLAARYEVPIHVKKISTVTIAERQKTGIQETARAERYKWFCEILTEITINKNSKKLIVTAHHLDDNIETMMMHFFRGSGIHGLRGILPRHGNIVRPLLSFRKTEVIKFAADNNLQWVEDSSNAEDKYTRNYFRNQLLPALRQVYKEVDQNLASNLIRLQETEILFNEAIALYRKKIIEEKGNEVYLLVEKLKIMPAAKTFIHEVISFYGFTAAQTDDVLQLLNSETGRYVESGKYRIFRSRRRLVIAPKESSLADHVLIENSASDVSFPSGTIKSEAIRKPKDITDDLFVALLDEKLISFPLLLRRWKPGDYFYPLGMKKKKKIARLLIDLKLSKTDKEKVWVIEMDKKILWVVGYRIDERFKISDNTEKVVKLTFSRFQELK